MNANQAGQSLIETILLGLVFLAPVLWGLGVLADLHRNALAATAAAREAGWEASRSIDVRSAQGSAQRAVEQAFRAQGLPPGQVRVRLSLGTLERGAPVEVVVSSPVTVFQAPFIGRVSGPSVWIHAKHVARVDPYRSRPSP